MSSGPQNRVHPVCILNINSFYVCPWRRYAIDMCWIKIPSWNQLGWGEDSPARRKQVTLENMSKRSVCILIGWWEFFNTRKFSILKFYSVNLSTMPCCCYLATKSCLTLCDPMDCSPPGSSVHGILQAGILEWVAIPLSWVSSRPRDRTHVSYLAGRFFTTKPPGRHPTMLYLKVFFFFFSFMHI